MCSAKTSQRFAKDTVGKTGHRYKSDFPSGKSAKLFNRNEHSLVLPQSFTHVSKDDLSQFSKLEQATGNPGLSSPSENGRA